MMKNNPLIILSAVLALLASCTPRQADDEIPATAAGTAPLQIESVGLQGSDGNSNDATRSTTRAADATTPVPLEEGIIGVFRIATNASSFASQNNISYTCKGGTWAPTVATDMIKLNSQPDKVCAYYPWQNGNNDPTKILLYCEELDERPGASYNVYNICYAAGRDVSSQYPSTSFEMKHAMALLRFHFKRAADATTSIKFNFLRIDAPEDVFIWDAYFDITQEGTVPVAKKAKLAALEVSLDAQPVTVPADGSEVTCAYLVVPCSFPDNGNKMKFAFTLVEESVAPNNTTVSASIPYSAFGGKWEAGKVYDISFTVKLGELILEQEGVTIERWEYSSVGKGYLPATPVP